MIHISVKPFRKSRCLYAVVSPLKGILLVILYIDILVGTFSPGKEGVFAIVYSLGNECMNACM